MRRRSTALPALALLLAGLTLPYSALRAQTPTAAAIDSIFAPWNRAGSPGCALGVLKNGEFVYQNGYGEANLDYGLKNGPEMVYYVGSVSKQFTAAAVALLAEEGRISLDDEARKYIPELPDYGRPLTIRQMIHHTSGLRDIYTLMDLAGLRQEDVMTDAEMIALIGRQKELNFPPGTDYLYSNSGYFLLGQIVKRVTGTSLREYADAKIFRPLGMTHTHFHDQPWTVLPRRAVSYAGSAAAGFRMNYLWNFDKVGAGGLYTTLGDLAKWDANFYQPKIGGPDFLKTIQTRGVLENGRTLTYAFGLEIDSLHGYPVVRHGGALMGFRADLLRFPTLHTSVITLCNLGNITPGPLANRVAALYLGVRPQATSNAAAARAAAVAAAAAETPAAPADPAAYRGRFWSDELDAAWNVAFDADGLTLSRRLTGTQRLRPASRDRFTAGSLVLAFERDAQGRLAAFTVEAGRVRHIRFVRQ